MKHLLLICILPFIMSFKANGVNKKDKSMKNESVELQYLVREPKDTTLPAPVLFLMHGYGSNESDLFSISSQIPDNWFVVSVRAPFEMSKSHYKWYDGELIDGTIVIDLETEEISRKALLQFIDKFTRENNVDKSKIVTAGFSQGAGLGLTLALMEPEKIYASACFNGRVMDQVKPLIHITKAVASKHVFIGHGTEDYRSPIKKIKENKKWLEDFGINVSFHTYKMGHSIVSEELDDFVAWLNTI